MTMRIPRELRFLLTVAVVAGALAACGDPASQTDATYVNVVDTTTLYALRGTSVVLPSGYDIPNKLLARTDVAAFDFAFDIDPAGSALMYPAGALGLARGPGILTTTVSFDSMASAPTTGYVDSVGVVITTGSVFVVKSRPDANACGLQGQLPKYAKFHVLAIDLAIRSVLLETLVDQNCGFRSLLPGTPTT